MEDVILSHLVVVIVVIDDHGVVAVVAATDVNIVAVVDHVVGDATAAVDFDTNIKINSTCRFYLSCKIT